TDAAGHIIGVVVGLRRERALLGAAAGQSVALDPLTGLADRQQFARHLREALADPERRSVAVFAINLDGFRNLNTLYGSAIGDQVLKIVAERLVRGTRSRAGEEVGDAMRGTDLVARIGADEFGIICGPPTLSLADVRAFAARLPRLIEAPI